MNWTNWLTLGLAVWGAATGTYSVIRQRMKDRPRMQVSGFVQKGDDGRRRLRIKLVNTGHIPVTVEQVFLTGGQGTGPKAWQLWEHNFSQPKLPKLLQPGEQLIVVTHLESIARPVMAKALTVMAKTADGREIKARRASGRKLAAEMKILTGEAEDPAKR